MFRSPILLALVLQGASAAAPAQHIDTAFGSAGLVRLGFQGWTGTSGGDGNADADRGVVACNGPQGSLVALGLASEGRRLVTAWLDNGGALDTRFSQDGKESFTLHAGGQRIEGAIGLCLPEGGMLLAYEVSSSAGAHEGNIHLRRINTSSGLPDPGFGNNGLSVLDLDTHAGSPIGGYETPLALNLDGEGGFLLSGAYEPTFPSASRDNSAAFVARFDGAGNFAAVSLLHSHDAELRQATAAIAGPDGSLWVAAARDPLGGGDNSPVTERPLLDVLRLDATTLLPLAPRLERFGSSLIPGRGIRLADGSFAISGRTVAGDGAIAVVDASRSQLLVLPSQANGARVVLQQVAQLADGDLLVAGDVAPPDVDFSAGVVYARVAGSTRSGLRLAPGFGSGGVLSLSLSGGPRCQGLLAPQQASRFTLWRGRPTLIGSIETNCPVRGLDSDLDYFVHRLLAPLLGDGFE